jgi:hypothetical protein
MILLEAIAEIAVCPPPLWSKETLGRGEAAMLR